MLTEVTYFGSTVKIPLRTWTNDKEDKPPRQDFKHDLWVERGEDWYALMAYKRKYPGEAVRVVEREVFIKAREEQCPRPIFPARKVSSRSMSGTVVEQFEVVRRIIDRLQAAGEDCNSGVVCDLADHLRTEVGYLRGYVEQSHVPPDGEGVRTKEDEGREGSGGSLGESAYTQGYVPAGKAVPKRGNE